MKKRCWPWLIVRYYRFIQLSKMLSKKKQGPCTSKNQPSSLKPHKDGSSLRRNYQKHSRRGTKDYEPIRMHALINHNFYASAQQSANQTILYHFNNLLYGHNCAFSLQFKEAIILASQNEHLLHYYILSKHRNQASIGRKLIQTSLVESIQNKAQTQFTSRAVMHFTGNVYTIMQKHINRRKDYLKKVANLYTYSSINQQQPKLWNKELPTLVSVRDREESQLNSSQSFQLKKLTECIREMFNKQGKDSIINWGGQSSWLAETRVEKKAIMNCDFSSIQSHSKNQLHLESKVREKWSNDAEENYGLGSLRRKYEQQRLSRIKQCQQTESKLILGHKRNPTETPYTKEHLFDEPMTPKDNCRSVFASTQNISPNSPRKLHKKSKKKEIQVNQAYLLRFEKKKMLSPQLKENKLKSSSKSKSKQKVRLMVRR